jgi:tripartite-type tricarboxylate transporter receptor subunit TctC
VPTTAEAGLPQLVVVNWYALLAPAGTPREIINRLNAELIKAVTAPDMQPRLAQAGVEPLTSTPEEFGNFIKSEAARFDKVIKEAGIKGE